MNDQQRLKHSSTHFFAKMVVAGDAPMVILRESLNGYQSAL